MAHPDATLTPALHRFALDTLNAVSGSAALSASWLSKLAQPMRQFAPSTAGGIGGRAQPAAGLVSSCNKSEISFDVDFDNRRKRARRMTRGVLTTARLIQQEMTEAKVRFRAAFITLTYRSDAEWNVKHISALTDHYRKWCRRQGCEFRYVWALELTQAGKPHYHIVAWLPRGVTPPLPDKQGWWPYGMTQAKWAHSPVGYIAKYASKGLDADQDPPKGARLWGSGGVSCASRIKRIWAMAPSWVRMLSGNADEVVRRSKFSGGGSCWEFPERGVRLNSPWELDLSLGIVRWRGWTEWDVEFI